MKFAMSLLNFRPGLIGGAETYVRQFIANLSGALGADRFVLVAYRDNAGAVPVPPGVEMVIVDRSDRQIVRLRAMEAFTPLRARGLEKVFRKIAPDAVFFPQQSLFPKALPMPSVMTVVDVQHLYFPRNFAFADRMFRATIYPYSLRRAARIVAISEFTRKCLIEKCNVPPGRVVAVPFGLSHRDTAALAPTDRIAGPYLYYPAATFPHKDHATLLRIFAALKRRGLPHRLVLTGKRTEHWPALEALIAELGIRADVVHPGFLPFDEVMRIYKGADAIVFPTRFEGFGLPVTEAVEFGKKVITSRLEVFDEIGVPRQWQIDFADPDQLAAALALPGPTRLEKPLGTWSQNVKATLDLLRQVAVERKSR